MSNDDEFGGPISPHLRAAIDQVRPFVRDMSIDAVVRLHDLDDGPDTVLKKSDYVTLLLRVNQAWIDAINGSTRRVLSSIRVDIDLAKLESTQDRLLTDEEETTLQRVLGPVIVPGAPPYGRARAPRKCRACGESGHDRRNCRDVVLARIAAARTKGKA